MNTCKSCNHMIVILISPSEKQFCLKHSELRNINGHCNEYNYDETNPLFSIDCTKCKYHNYDWNVNDGYGGEEYEICEKNQELYPIECGDFKKKN